MPPTVSGKPDPCQSIAPIIPPPTRTHWDDGPGETALNKTLDRYASLPKWPMALGGAVAVAAAVVGGLAAPDGDRTMVLLPVAVAIGLAALVLAATRFEVFVGCILLIRASIDTIEFGSRTLDASGAISVLFVGASCLWLLARQEGSEQLASPVAVLLPPIAALFLCALVSVLFSEHPLESLVEVVRFGTLIVIVAALGRVVRDERSMRFVLLAALGSAIVPLLVGFRQITGGGGVLTASGLDRVRGTFLHSNPFAAYLFLMIILAVSLYPHFERRWKLVLGPLAVACGACLIATYSRGAWAATILALVMVGILQDRRILWLLGATSIVAVLAIPSIGTRLSDLTESQKESGAPGNSLVWRLQYWQQVLALQDDPLFGIGFKEVELGATAASTPPHNDPIRIFVETGFLGLAAYAWLLITLGIQARATLDRAPPGVPRGLAVAFAATLAGIVLLSLSANLITQLVILWYFMTIVVLAIAGSWFPVANAPRS
jgi:putative inorganic carbon (HCO3(-)) transporter